MYMSNCVDALIPPSRLTADTRAEFRRTALAYLAQAAMRSDTSITVDLSATSEVDASGLGILLFVQSRAKENGMTVHLARVPQPVRALLELTKLIHVFDEVSC
jgi:ABC-type transporter Mla MlaB component